MERITSTVFQRDLGRTMSQAKRSPITITNHGRDELVILEASEFERLKQLDERQSYFAWEMSKEQLDALENAQPSEDAEALNHLME